MNQNTLKIIELSNQAMSSAQIAQAVGLSRRYVSKLQQRLDLPRLNKGARNGQKNHRFVSGRQIGLDGYVYVSAPKNHPYACVRAGRQAKTILEHRLVMERKLGRYLLPTEVVDHIDGLTLHNAPENLRLFQSNADHLETTIAGKQKLISPAGREKLRKPRHQISMYPTIDSHGQRKKAGDVRLRQILLAALSLGADSPYLLGTSHHTKKAGIDLSDRSKIERALADLSAKWALGRTLL